MEHGDIDQPVSPRSVVTMVPTLLTLADYSGRSPFTPLRKRVAQATKSVRHNVMMLRWIESTAFIHSVPFEVWYIAPFGMYHDLLFDNLVLALSDYTQRGVVAWEHYDEDTAAEVLTMSPHIATLYDADHDRVQRRWPHRGYRVPLGGTP